MSRGTACTDAAALSMQRCCEGRPSVSRGRLLVAGTHGRGGGQGDCQ